MKIFYIDPMSYNNLSKYDREFLNHIPISEKHYYCNKKLEFNNFKNTKIKKVFSYSNKTRLLKGISYAISSAKVFFDAVKYKPDVMHYQWFKIPLLDYLLIKFIKLFIDSKIVFTAHNVLPHDSGDKYKKIYKKIYDNLDGIIVHTEKTKEELISQLRVQNNNIFVIPHGLLNHGELRNKYEEYEETQLEKCINISFIGHLNHYKGIDLLIDAWNNSSVLKESSRVKLTIAGKGKIDFKGIEKLKNTKIINKFLDEEELDSIIKGTDVVVLPYRKISQSGVLLSILNEKKAVIVSNVGGLTEPFLFGDIGWILNDISVEELKTVLEEVTVSESRIKSIHNDKALWDKINNYYDWNVIGEKMDFVYKQINS